MKMKDFYYRWNNDSHGIWRVKAAMGDGQEGSSVQLNLVRFCYVAFK